MRSKKLKLFLAIVIILVLISSPFIYEAISVLYFSDHSIRKNFNSVKIGASKENVIAKLGVPDKQDIEFHLGQYGGFEQEYAKAEKSGSKYYLFWYGEIDMVYVLGLNDRDQVILKSCGGT
jgi:hypothetical protein